MKKVCIKAMQCMGFLGFILILGAVGASDMDLITIEALILRAFIGTILMAISFAGVKLEEKSNVKNQSWR